MRIKDLYLDLRDIREWSDFHQRMKAAFGFPDIYGANGAALVDCLSSLRIPEDEMTGFFLEVDDVLRVHVQGYGEMSPAFRKGLIAAFRAVNIREELRQREFMPFIVPC